MTPPNDADDDITLDSMDPPTTGGRVLQWSGDQRIPHLGELVFYVPEVATEETLAGIVVGYFQTHGFLGVKLRLGENDVIAVFGAEVVANPEKPKQGTPN